MADPDPLAAVRQQARPFLPLWVKIVIALCCGIEALLLICDLLGWRLTVVISQPGILSYFNQQRIGIPIRQAVDFLFGFFSAQFHARQGVYPGQPAIMFLTYGLLHAGPIHLGMNMLSLVALARELNRLIGPARMALVYALSQVAAALLFARMTPDGGPMIGASGAIFGLAGALVGFAAMTGWRRRRPLGQLWRGVAVMVVLNVALTVLMPSIAWQAHLGGTLAGLVMGAGMALARDRRTSAF